jgi:hypothetical protein
MFTKCSCEVLVKVRKVVGGAIALLAILTFAILVVAGSRIIVSAAPAKIEYVDVVTIVLAALSIMITVLGIFIAILGVVGWATFESKLKDTSLQYFREQLSQGSPLRAEFEKLLVQISLEGVEKADAPESVTGPAPKDAEYVD